MKNIMLIGIVLTFTGLSSSAFAQDSKQMSPQQKEDIKTRAEAQKSAPKNKPVKRRTYEKAPAKIIYREEIKKEVK